MDLEQEDLRLLRRCVRLFKQRMQACASEEFKPLEWEDDKCYVWHWEVTGKVTFCLTGRHRTTPKGEVEFGVCYKSAEWTVEVTAPLLSADCRKAGDGVVRWLCKNVTRAWSKCFHVCVNSYTRRF
jgi:hypothetical protein